MKQSLLVFSLFFFFLLFSLSFAKAEEYYISDCSVLDQENATYYLTEDLYSETSCIKIASNNIVFDCNYHTITGNGSESAVWTYNTNNITVRNCILTNFSEVVWGVANNSRFQNLEISNGVVRGITLDGENLTLSNITIHSSNTGLSGTMQFSEMSNIKVHSSDWGVNIFGYNNTLSDLELWNITTYSAITLNTGGNMRVENTIIRDSWGVGIWVDWESNGNTIDNVTIYNLPNDFPIYITSDNNTVKNSLIYNSYAGIGIHGNGDYDTLENIEVFNTSDYGIFIDGSNHVLRNLTVHSTRGISVWGSNHLLENIETFDTTPESAGLAINSENTILRNIYNHDEYRSTLGGNNNTLEYSRCENVTYGCWHIFGDNTTMRHNDFFRLEFYGVNSGEVYNNSIGRFIIGDWENRPSAFIKIYNNTIYTYLLNYGSNSIEIYNNYFYDRGVFDSGGINTSVHNNFFNVSWAIAFFNTNSHAFSNEIHSNIAFYLGGTKNVVINDNIIEANTLVYYYGYYGNIIENITSCNNTIITFNKSWDYNPNYNISLLNVMRIESDSCEPYVSIVSTEPVGFGSVKIGKESNATVPITIRSNMINVSILVRGDSDFPDFPISSVAFLADKDKPYPVEEVQIEKGVAKAVSVFLPSLTSTLHSLWKIGVPSGIAAGSKQARATIFASIPQASDSRQLVLSLDAVPEVAPKPRLYQLSPIAGILAYVLLPIVFAMIAQKYLLGEVELTLQGLIKYLLIFVMIIIVAIGFAYVFSVL
jgi:hypothetical protein